MNLLEKTEQLFHSARVSYLEAVAHLYKVQQTDAWKEKYDTWGEFVESLGVSQSGASKMLTTYKHFVIEGAVSHAKLATVDLEKLYLATSLEGTPTEQLIKAETLSRSEIKAQRSFEESGHECEHPEEIRICKDCNKRLG